MKARYSPIAPIHLLQQLYREGALGDYLLFLAHDVLAHPEEYETLVAVLRDEDKEPFIIMDNSVVELGHPMVADDVIEAACVIEASCIMTPDVLGNFEKTQTLVLQDRQELMHSGFPLMRVPQGSTIDEIKQCIEWLSDRIPPHFAHENYWAVPRWVTNNFGTRIEIIQYILATQADPKIHLLGMSKNVADDLDCTTIAHVMGIDSANPLVMGQAGLHMSDEHTYAHWDRGSFWAHKLLTTAAIDNVRYMHQHVG